MSFEVVQTTLSSALASAGTFDVSYPTSTNAGNFRGAVGHKIATGQGDIYSSPDNFTVSFGTSNITITEVDMLLPADTKLYIQLEKRGENDGDPTPDTVGIPNVVPVQQVVINLGAPDTLDADGIFDGVAAEDAVLVYDSDDFKTGFNGTLDVPRALTLVGSAGADHVCTITGTDAYGNTMVENLTATGTTPVAGKKAFATVATMSVAVGQTGDTLDLGWGDVIGLPVFVGEAHSIAAELKDGVLLPRELPKVRVPFDLPEVELLAGDLVSVPCPVAGTISRIVSMVGIAIGTGGTLTLKVNNTAVDGLSLVVADAAPAGALDSDTPTAGHASTAVAVDDEIEIVPDAAFATSGSLYGYIEIIPSTFLHGTLVAGVDTVPTATTGDIRGTYAPVTACSGAIVYELIANLTDPAYKGRSQFAG